VLKAELPALQARSILPKCAFNTGPTKSNKGCFQHWAHEPPSSHCRHEPPSSHCRHKPPSQTPISSVDRTQEKHRFVDPRKPKCQSQGKSATSTSMPPMTHKQAEGKKPM